MFLCQPKDKQKPFRLVTHCASRLRPDLHSPTVRTRPCPSVWLFRRERRLPAAGLFRLFRFFLTSDLCSLPALPSLILSDW